MKKINLILLSIAFLSFLTDSTFAQLSDRINSPTTFKAGTRPVSGNLGVSIGTSYNELEKIYDGSEYEYETLPLVNLMYYYNDKLAITLGFKTSKDKLVLKGTIDSESHTNLLELSEIDFKYLSSKFLIVPGIQKHFGSSNILDVYVGAKIPLGLVTELHDELVSFENSDIVGYTSTQRSFSYGFNGIVGVQAFIADLPLAIGIEFVFSTFGYLGNKNKIEEYYKIGDVTESYVYYYADDEAYNEFDSFDASYDYTTLKARKSGSETDVRISLTYFFNK